MLEQAAMQRIATLAAAAIFGALMSGALMFGATPALAAPLHDEARAAAAGTDISAQARSRRARPQLRVYPRRYPYRTFHTPYPVPYPIEAPGPNMVRQCAVTLVQQARQSGTVIVPRMRCRWARR